MADVEFSVSLTGPRVDIALLGRVAYNLRLALTEIERSITGEIHAEWSAGDEAILRATASPNGTTEATLRQIIHQAREGFESASRNLSSRTYWPSDIPPKAQKAIRDIVRVIEEVDGITVQASAEAPVVIEKPVLDHSLEIADKRGFHESSSVEGVLDLISVRGRPHFSIKDRLSLRAVRCRVPDEMFDEVRAALGENVVVEGIVKYRQDGTPVSISAITKIWRGTATPVPLHELRGSTPDLTGGLSAGEYVRRIREEDEPDG
jgi:hypothetical protein